ncbi:M16 family metallopeptidase [Verminephrobacter aporrectodeae]|uniref:M16 family metallopeptidase n=1 Tax=Verminephrobacter aporrectodeae TaxID=1110389 RepID=UPI002A60F8D9|nr:insulinase family protein [Verminephrobacter aporrectodeae subsp. tuberculatae]MCW8203898.1 insulinase family protein [Verminephrobacter aporrectodeae subsp. tuberculatae]
MRSTQHIAMRALLIGAAWFFSSPCAWALLPIEHWTEPGGARVWLVHSPVIPMVDVQIDFDAGSRRDPAAQAGLAGAVATMASKGVQGKGAEPPLDENALGEAWADLGAGFEARADNDTLHYWLRTLTDAPLLEHAARLAARQIAEPEWNEALWQRERARWSASLREADTHPATVAEHAFAAAVYGSHPYGQRSTPQTLARIGVADLQDFHARHVAACRARVSIVGAVSRAQAQTLVATLLARLPATPDCAPLPDVGEVAALTAPAEQRIPFASAQAHVLIGQPGFQRRDPDFLALLVGNHILGGGGFVSRLTHALREQRGLSYSVYSYFAPGLHAGAFTVGLQTRPDQAAEAVEVARAQLARFIAEGPTEAELRAAKDNLVGGFALRIDSNKKLLGNVANIAWNDLPLDYLEQWSQKVQALTVDEVRAAMARKLQPERMVTVVVGGQP